MAAAFCRDQTPGQQEFFDHNSGPVQTRLGAAHGKRQLMRARSGGEEERANAAQSHFSSP
ncbi:hypothetical protein [Paracoccus sp. SCSIO 75233]|uniref:hypothetical protein n=1 Tax=Paracoccus sp. SCSIO 75233 TaxID=3017782 RepID=UPI0022F143BE|nr:hypothetical protein [Paracoccus sp. SCSIO 75233]WBU54223.1 hypothetical protein PAF12_05160 [Paracoccus sp. SCSIO 75233]